MKRFKSLFMVLHLGNSEIPRYLHKIVILSYFEPLGGLLCKSDSISGKATWFLGICRIIGF